MNILSIKSHNFAINFKDIAITIGNEIYSNLTFIFRLMTIDELMRLNSLNTDNLMVKLEAEEEIFNLCLIDVIGLDKKIDLDKIESGIISTIAVVIVKRSTYYLLNTEEALQKEPEYLTIYDQMQLMVCKHFNMNFNEVVNLPIDDLIRKFALIQITFPPQEPVNNG